MWLEYSPHCQPVQPPALDPSFPDPEDPAEIQATGCVIVSPESRIVSMGYTVGSNAIVRCLMTSKTDPRGCDVYVSRYPDTLGMKLMVQAGIRKVFYFPG